MKERRTFELRSGARSLDLVDTVAARAAAPVELLATPHDLQRWLQRAGLLHGPLRPLTARDLQQTCRLREAIYRSARAVSEGAAPDESDVRLINAAALQPPPRPQLKDGIVTYCALEPLRAALSALAADAIECFGPARRERIRRCPECQMLFLDTSRPGRRRWCSSASGCGNRAKVRRHRERAARRREA